MLRPWLREPRLVPWIAAPATALLATNEALLDDGFRPYVPRILVVAAVLGVGFLVAAVRPTLGAVLVATFYPVGQALGVPGPGGAGLIAVLVALAWAGYAEPPARSRWALLAGIVRLRRDRRRHQCDALGQGLLLRHLRPGLVARRPGPPGEGALARAR